MDENIIAFKRKKHKHILGNDRVIIERMRRAKFSEGEIIRAVGCSKRTYRREIARGRCEQLDSECRTIMVYFADHAQLEHERGAKNKGPYAKLNNNPELRSYVEKKIKEEHFSPDAVLMSAKAEGMQVDISTKTLYNSIDRGDVGVTRQDLLRKEGWKQEKAKQRQGFHTKGKSIDERPAEAKNRTEPGHFEGDLVVSKKDGFGGILTLTDRMNRKEIIVKLKSKEQAEVERALRDLPLKVKATFKTITFDNGPEFLNFEKLKAAFRQPVEIYYAHPYSSWERGTNENHNGIIRRFFPKGSDFSKISVLKLKTVQAWMNNYPRRKLGGLTPNQSALSA